MVKFLTDENIFPAIVKFLRDRGFDVRDTREEGMSGISDATLMNLARQENMTFVTFDKHFTNILLYPPSSHCGLIRIRIHPPLISDILQALERFLLNFDLETLIGTLIILERDGFRMRRSP